MSSLKPFIDINKWGNYPVGYNPAQHGPYDPSRYYGKPDVAFGEVKLGELLQWFSRREKGFRPFASLLSRGFWRWQMKYVMPRKASPASILQLIAVSSIFFYTINYLRIRGHRNYKYH